MKKLILIDGNAIIHRAFHAMPPFKTSQGELVNAVYGFGSMLLNIMNNEKPDCIAVSFDTKAKTFRHEEYDDYKATRVKAPDELYSQIPRIHELVETFEIPIYKVDGFEADDVLGTLATQAEQHDDIKTLIATGDHDTMQLVTEKTNLLMPAKGFSQSSIITPQKVFEKYGLSPSQIPDLKGLQGDSSDNIKGVKGVGAKTATTLLQKYGSIENIYEHLQDITGSVHDKLANDRDSAFFSKKLATIIKDVDISLDLNNCKTHEYDHEKVQKFFESLQFNSLIKKLHSFNNYYSKIPRENDKKQQSLF